MSGEGSLAISNMAMERQGSGGTAMRNRAAQLKLSAETAIGSKADLREGFGVSYLRNYR